MTLIAESVMRRSSSTPLLHKAAYTLVAFALVLPSSSCTGKKGDDPLVQDTAFIARGHTIGAAESPLALESDASRTTPAIDLAHAATVKSWRTIRAGDAVTIGTLVANTCDLLSPVTLIDKEGDPRYGGLFLLIKGDSAIAIDGSGVGVLFRTVAGVAVYSGSDSVQINAGEPVQARHFLTRLSDKAPSHLVAYLRYTDGQSSKLNFRMVGFERARSARKPCETALRSTSAAKPRTGKSLSLKAFLQSDVAKENSIRAKDGWALTDGLYNNLLAVPREPELSFELSTRGDNVVNFGMMIMGSRRPDEDQLRLMNDMLRYAATALGSSAIPPVRAEDFSRRYEQINEAKARRKGSLAFRTGSVGGDAILSVDVSG